MARLEGFVFSCTASGSSGCGSVLSRVMAWVLIRVLGGLIFVVSIDSVAAQGAVLTLQLEPQRVALAGAMAVLQTTQALEAAPDLLLDAAFEPMPGYLNGGFGASDFWLRFTLQAATPLAAGTWWLEVPPAFTNELALYAAGPAGVTRVGRAGTEVPFAQRQVASRHGVFVIELAPGGGAQTYFLRVASKTTRAAAPVLWRPAAFMQASQVDTLLQGVFFGGVVVVAVSSLFMGLWLRQQIYLMYAVYVALGGGIQFLAQGFAQQWWFPLSTGLFNMWMGAGLCLAIGLGGEVVRLVRPQVYFPLLARSFRRVTWGLALMLLPLALMGYYGLVAPVAQLAFIAQVLFFLVVSFLIWRRGEVMAGYFMLAFVAYSAAVLVFLPRNLGWLPLNFWTLNSLQIGFFLHLLLMNLTVARHVRGLRDDAERTRGELLSANRLAAHDLDKKVVERTQEMHLAMLSANEASRAKTEFLARVSHDLRSPLTSIMGYAQLLQEAGGKTSAHARIIRRSAWHMLNLINDLIDYARGASSDTLEPSALYIHGVLDAVVQEAKILADKNNNRFMLDIRNELPTVLVTDGKRLRQVLINLLQNASKFTRDGVIELLVTSQPQVNDSRLVTLICQIKDTGCGISQKDQLRVFDPFFRTAGATQSDGVGLGLPIVEAWVKRMGGTVRLHSTPDVGTEVTLHIPMVLGSEQDMSQPQMLDVADYLSALDGGGRRVWVVEDTAEIRELLLEELQGNGFDVQSAANGLEFITRMTQPGAVPPSLVLTDYLMPGADGTAVLEAVRRHWPGVPVVLLSATQKTMESLGELKAHGFDASLMKPINLADLRSTLSRLLGLMEGEVIADEPVIPSMTLPPPEALAQMSRLVDMGALTDLIEWAQALTRTYPDCQAFADRVLALATECDLGSMRNLCASDPGSSILGGL